MSDMIERVSAAILAVDKGRVFLESELEAFARAAIEAMREPTEAMLRASPVVGTGINEDGRWGINTRPAQDVWRAMIDVALK